MKERKLTSRQEIKEAGSNKGNEERKREIKTESRCK